EWPEDMPPLPGDSEVAHDEDAREPAPFKEMDDLPRPQIDARSPGQLEEKQKALESLREFKNELQKVQFKKDSGLQGLLKRAGIVPDNKGEKELSKRMVDQIDQILAQSEEPSLDAAKIYAKMNDISQFGQEANTAYYANYKGKQTNSDLAKVCQKGQG